MKLFKIRSHFKHGDKLQDMHHYDRLIINVLMNVRKNYVYLNEISIHMYMYRVHIMIMTRIPYFRLLHHVKHMHTNQRILKAKFLLLIVNVLTQYVNMKIKFNLISGSYKEMVRDYFS